MNAKYDVFILAAISVLGSLGLSFIFQWSETCSLESTPAKNARPLAPSPTVEQGLDRAEPARLSQPSRQSVSVSSVEITQTSRCSKQTIEAASVLDVQDAQTGQPVQWVRVTAWKVELGVDCPGDATTFVSRDSHVRMDNLGEGTFNMIVSSREHREGRLHDVILPLECSRKMLLSPMSSIQGRISDARGHPVREASIRLKAQPGDSSNERVAGTDANGVFRFAGLEPGTYTVCLEGHESVANPAFVVKEGEAVNRDLVLNLGGSLTVQVRGSDGMGLHGARVRLRSDCYHARESASPLGDVTLSSLPPGSYSLSVSKLGFESVEETVEIGSESHGEIFVTLNPAGSTHLSQR